MIDPQHGWAYSRSHIAITSDGAQTFHDVTPPGLSGDQQIWSPLFLDAAHAYVFVITWDRSTLKTSVLERTSDGGATWAASAMNPALYGDLTFVDPLHGWLVSGQGSADHLNTTDTLRRTVDGGKSWTAIYSYPYRHEFVAAAEHGAWPGELKQALAAREQKPLELSEFALMRRGHWDPERARLSFGCASFLALQPGPKVAQAFASLQAYRDEQNRKDQGDGTWTRDPLYEIPADKQLELLEKELGPKLMERVSAFLAKGGESFKALAHP